LQVVMTGRVAAFFICCCNDHRVSRFAAVLRVEQLPNVTLALIKRGFSDEDDGTLQKLSAKYLAAAWGTDPAKVPYFQP
jgi:hypothetical protein